MLTRRAATAGLLAAAGCSPGASARRGDAVAAGQPAALLIWAVARERLAGWPRKPVAASLAELPPLAATLPELGSLTGAGGRPADLEAVAALRPRLILDYGDTGPEYQALARRLGERLDVPWRLIDGDLVRIPQAIREAARLLDAPDDLADTAAQVLERWRTARPGPSFYYARGSDGLETGFRGALATQVLEGAGWANVARGARDIGRVGREQIAAWDPETLVTLSPAFARVAADDPVWRRRRDGSRRRLLLLPETPFGWLDRPPSVNRLLGCAWLARPEGEPMALAALSRRLYGLAPAEVRLPRWID